MTAKLSCRRVTGDYVLVGGYPFVLWGVAGPDDWGQEIARLVREAAQGFRVIAHRSMAEALAQPGRTTISASGMTCAIAKHPAAAGRWHPSPPLSPSTPTSRWAEGQPVWPSDKDPDKPAVYIRRIVVGRPYAGHGLGAALLDWAAETAEKE